jgi:hypothetical protein
MQSGSVRHAGSWSTTIRPSTLRLHSAGGRPTQRRGQASRWGSQRASTSRERAGKSFACRSEPGFNYARRFRGELNRTCMMLGGLAQTS